MHRKGLWLCSGTTILTLLALAAGGSAAGEAVLGEGHERQAGELLFFAGSFLAFFAVLWVIGILIAFWVYRDAGTRGMNKMLWFIVIFFTGLIGLAVYLIIRRNHPVADQGERPAAREHDGGSDEKTPAEPERGPKRKSGPTEVVEMEEVEVGEPAYDPDLQEPPSLRPGTVLAVIKKKGLIGAMKDEAMGPHMHLLLILGVVVIIAISVGAMSWAAG